MRKELYFFERIFCCVDLFVTHCNTRSMVVLLDPFRQTSVPRVVSQIGARHSLSGAPTLSPSRCLLVRVCAPFWPGFFLTISPSTHPSVSLLLCLYVSVHVRLTPLLLPLCLGCTLVCPWNLFCPCINPDLSPSKVWGTRISVLHIGTLYFLTSLLSACYWVRILTLVLLRHFCVSRGGNVGPTVSYESQIKVKIF